MALLTACGKDSTVAPVQPKMRYTDLQDAEVKYNSSKNIDLKDGQAAPLFEALLAGDPVLQRDRLPFYAKSEIGAYLLNDAQDQSPFLDREVLIAANHSGYT